MNAREIAMGFDVCEASAAKQICHRFGLIVPVLEGKRGALAQITRRIGDDGAERVQTIGAARKRDQGFKGQVG
jgi:hypothetical protein